MIDFPGAPGSIIGMTETLPETPRQRQVRALFARIDAMTDEQVRSLAIFGKAQERRVAAEIRLRRQEG
jgi:hypothetical protein